MLRPYSQLKQEVYLAPKQSVRADLSSVKTFAIALSIFFCICLTLTFIAQSSLFHGFGIHVQPVVYRKTLNPFIFSAVLSTATGLIVFVQSSILRKVTFNFPMIKAFQPKKF
ncbi:MAG: hypothetical protein COY39_05740 [Alphaproteobacteria bacterium CG_4_10_14_0_8_um_filter_37_21]|nr:MAG: hypothetical protein COY39_05740 [Alphaproteobacteria bacterium CG_4_10_14_0_8_um_filter_37_21]